MQLAEETSRHKLAMEKSIHEAKLRRERMDHEEFMRKMAAEYQHNKQTNKENLKQEAVKN
jgi:hypothetical protein